MKYLVTFTLTIYSVLPGFMEQKAGFDAFLKEGVFSDRDGRGGGAASVFITAWLWSTRRVNEEASANE